MSDPREEILPLVPHLRAFARSFTRDADDADDLVQDTLMLALRSWGRFTPGTNLRAWLFTILRNRFYSVRARKHVTSEVHVDDLSYLAATPAVQEQRIELPGFKVAFARLPASHARVALMRMVEGEDPRLARPLAPRGSGPRGAARGLRGDGQAGHDPAHAPPSRAPEPQAATRLLTFETASN